MAWMSDEKYTYVQDCKEKKITARSARHARTHCGKRGSVKLPSDFKTKKELKAMNGECKSYRMNEPMSWEEFKQLPDDLKVTYIKGLRERFSVPNNILAECMGVHPTTFSKYMTCYGLNIGKSASGASKQWDRRVEFETWWNGDKDEETCDPVEEDEVDIPESEDCSEETYSYAPDCPEKMIRNAGPIAFAGNSIPVIPKNGSMTFENNNVDDILTTLKTMLGGVRANLTVSWEVV